MTSEPATEPPGELTRRMTALTAGSFAALSSLAVSVSVGDGPEPRREGRGASVMSPRTSMSAILSRGLRAVSG